MAAACSLTTSLDGLSTGGDAAPLDGGSKADAADATATGSDAAVDGGSAAEAGATGYRATVLADSPLAYYRFDDTGAVAKDETGAHDGTYKGAVTHAPGALGAGSSMAAVFDGSTWIEVGDVLPFTGNAPFTIEAWASPVAGGADPMCMVAKTFAPGGATGGVAEGYGVYLDSGTNAVNLSRWKSSAATGPTGPALANGRFTHVVASYDGANSVLYVDGARMASSPSATVIASVTNPLTIGAGRGGVYCYFRGALDEVAIYGAALPDARVLAHYAAGVAK